MPQFKVGDMWSVYDNAALFCITTNAYVTQFEKLTMGRGIAKQARDRFPGLDERFGANLVNRQMHLGKYGIIVDVFTRICAFQVKYHWRDKASVELIDYSIEKLLDFMGDNEFAVHLNFPGIGNGGLHKKDVLPHLLCLPNCITIWENK